MCYVTALLYYTSDIILQHCYIKYTTCTTQLKYTTVSTANTNHQMLLGEKSPKTMNYSYRYNTAKM